MYAGTYWKADLLDNGKRARQKLAVSDRARIPARHRCECALPASAAVQCTGSLG
jgi:hypothetical protein